MTTAATLEPVDGGGPVVDHAQDAIGRLRDLAASGEHGYVTWRRPEPTAAFSRRDAREDGFASAVQTVRDLGFAPIIRPVGGRLAVYHQHSLVVDVWLGLPDPRPGTTARFRLLADVLARGLRHLGVDARVGAVPREYCPGDWSINGGGLVKLIGSGQRLVQRAGLYSAVIVVDHADPLRDAVARAYADLGLDVDPNTVGAVSDFVPGVTVDDVRHVLGHALEEFLPLGGPDPTGSRRFTNGWDPR